MCFLRPVQNFRAQYSQKSKPTLPDVSQIAKLIALFAIREQRSRVNNQGFRERVETAQRHTPEAVSGA
jgi:hypothetical protein